MNIQEKRKCLMLYLQPKVVDRGRYEAQEEFVVIGDAYPRSSVENIELTADEIKQLLPNSKTKYDNEKDRWDVDGLGVLWGQRSEAYTLGLYLCGLVNQGKFLELIDN